MGAVSHKMCACVCVFMLNCGQLFCDLVDCSPPGLSVHGIFQQECWSGIKPGSHAVQVDSLPLVLATWVNGR